ncbi:MAG: hypothetical protein ACI8YQ_002460 [Polaribacter sp.]|jgi:hypothetical protein
MQVILNLRISGEMLRSSERKKELEDTEDIVLIKLPKIKQISYVLQYTTFRSYD